MDTRNILKSVCLSIDPNDDHKYGMNRIAAKDIEHMRQLSSEIGGWIMFNDSTITDLGKFIPFDKWQEIYADFEG